MILIYQSWKDYISIYLYGGFPGASEGKESACNVGDLGSVRVEKIPWRRAWQPTPVCLPAESPWIEEPGRLHSMGLQSWTWLSDLAQQGIHVYVSYVQKYHIH